jgi:hypothetical protein
MSAEHDPCEQPAEGKFLINTEIISAPASTESCEGGERETTIGAELAMYLKPKAPITCWLNLIEIFTMLDTSCPSGFPPAGSWKTIECKEQRMSAQLSSKILREMISRPTSPLDRVSIEALILLCEMDGGRYCIKTWTFLSAPTSEPPTPLFG